MGIYDREYYRREGPGFLGSIVSRGQVCKWLIAINVICFIFQIMTPSRSRYETVFDEDGAPQVAPQRFNFTSAFQLDTQKVAHGQVWRLLTYAFLHDPTSIWHIVFNMLFLWWFGTDIEDIYGPREFLAFYLVAAVAGGLAFQLAWAANLQSGQLCIGASGAVTAVMVVCAMHYPGRLIYVMGILPVPIWLFVAFQVAQDTLTFASGVHTRTAVTGHLGGALFGFLYYRTHMRLMNYVPDLRGWRRQLSRPRLRVYREDVRQRPVTVTAPPVERDIDERLEAKLDAVLEKVARSGRDSLSDSEREILQRASEAYKKRRS